MESLKGVGDCCPSHAGGTDLCVYNCFLKLLLFHWQGVCGFSLASGFHHSHKFIYILIRGVPRPMMAIHRLQCL